MTTAAAITPTICITCCFHGVAPTMWPVFRSCRLSPPMAAAQQTTAPTRMAAAGPVALSVPRATSSSAVASIVAIVTPEIGLFDDPTSPTPKATFPLGTTEVSLTVDDGNGETDSDVVLVSVVDTTPPAITMEMTPASLWPPNHKLVDIQTTVTATDVCDLDPDVVLVLIESNEPDNGSGDGDHPDDIQAAELGTQDYKFQLRAERAGDGEGRVYTVTYKATDASGNESTAAATVTVGHDQGKGKGAVVSSAKSKTKGKKASKPVTSGMQKTSWGAIKEAVK